MFARGVRIPVLVAALGAGASTNAFAQGAPLPRLLVDRSENSGDCPDAPALAGMVERQMKRPSLEPATEADPADRAMTVTVRIARTEEGYAATVAANGRSRQLSDAGSTCTGLAEALAVTLAILLDAELLAPAVPAPTPVPPPVRVPPPAAPPPPTPPAPSPRFLTLEATAVLTGEILASPAFGFTLAADARLAPRLQTALGALVLPLDRIRFDPGTVDVSLAAGFARGSVRFAGSEQGTTISAYGAGYVGALSGQGHGYAVNKRATHPWVALGSGISINAPLTDRLGFVLRGGALVAFGGQKFRVTGASGSAFSQEPVGGVLDAGIRASIW